MKRVHTIAGPFDEARLKTLTETLDQAESEGLDRKAIIKFEGQDLVIAFGRHLETFVRGEMEKQENAGL